VFWSGPDISRAYSRLVRCELQAVSGLRVRRGYRTRRELDDRERAEAERHPPWDKCGICLEDSAIPAHKDDIDRKAHEKRVNGATRSDDQRCSFREFVAPEESAATAPGVERELDAGRDDAPAANVLKGILSVRASEQHGEKRGTSHSDG
jgi:hypothetical protein